MLSRAAKLAGNVFPLPHIERVEALIRPSTVKSCANFGCTLQQGTARLRYMFAVCPMLLVRLLMLWQLPVLLRWLFLYRGGTQGEWVIPQVAGWLAKY